MKRICIFAILAASPATAGSFNPTLEDPTVTPPACHTLFGLPCHRGFNYDEPEGGTPDPRPTPQPKPQPKPQPPVECSMNEWVAGTQYANSSKPKKECA